MKYAILVYETDDDFSAPTDKAQPAGYLSSYQAHSQHLGDRITRGERRFRRSTALQRSGYAAASGSSKDGPFANTKEKLAGFHLVEASNLDEALEMAAKCPSASTGSVEVRPLHEM